MKNIVLFFMCTLFSYVLQAQSLIGAWESTYVSKSGERLKNVVIFADGYQVSTTYDANSGAFVNTNGGKWTLKDNTLTEHIEFHTANAELVGTKPSFEIRITDNEIEIVDSGMTFKRIDDGAPGELQGAWLISGRVRDGKTQSRDTSRPRKTMKILSGTRFQWIAYNTETKEFKGTGGGTYTTENGEYTENIEFFSRDDSKAGLSLEFNYELIDGNWHHKGLSSKGQPIHEIWSIRE